MNAGAVALVFLVGAVLATWLVLRLVKPKIERKFRTAFVAGASALLGFALAFVTLGRYKRKKPEPEPDTGPKPTTFNDGEHNANVAAVSDTDSDPVPNAAVDDVISDILSE